MTQTDEGTAVLIKVVLAGDDEVWHFMPGALVFVGPQAGDATYRGQLLPAASLSPLPGMRPFGFIAPAQRGMQQLLARFDVYTLCVTVAGVAHTMVPYSADHTYISRTAHLRAKEGPGAVRVGTVVGHDIFCVPRPFRAANSYCAVPPVGSLCAKVHIEFGC